MIEIFEKKPCWVVDTEMSNQAFNNFSTKSLSSSERLALGLGAKTWLPNKTSLSEFQNDLSRFSRLVHLRDFFTTKNLATGLPINSPFSKPPMTSIVKSTYHPGKEYHDKKPRIHTWTLTEKIVSDTLALLEKYRPTHRPSKTLSDALNGIAELKGRDDIVIKLSDKNLGITVLDKEHYRKLVFDHLNDRKTYVPLESSERLDPLTKIKYIRLCKAGVRILGNGVADEKYLKILLERVEKEAWEVPHFYGIPKIHKSPLALRPISASHSYFCTALAELINFYLLKLAKQLPTVCHASADVAREISRLSKSLNRKEMNDLVFITGDVTALYPNIPTKEALELLGPFLSKNLGSLGAWLTSALRFCLDNHSTQFEGVIYRQISGTAMGVQFAPSYANIYLFLLHQDIVFDNVSSPSERKLKEGIHCYLRYIDDIFISGTEDAVKRTTSALNLRSQEIKITWSNVDERAVFLDLDIRKHFGSIEYSVFSKPISRFLYIPFASFHPISKKRGFIITEILRFVRLSSKRAFFVQACQSFYKHLRERGYPAKMLNSVFDSIDYYLERSLFLEGTARRQPRQNSLAPLVFSSAWTPFMRDETELRAVLNPNPSLRLGKHHGVRGLDDCSVRITVKSAPSIGKELIRASTKPKTDARSYDFAPV